MKKLTIIVVAIVAIVFVLGLTKDLLVKSSVSALVKAMTGLGLDIGQMKVGILKQVVGINNMLVFNPMGFPDKVMANIPEIYVDYDLGAILRQKVHLKELRLNLKEFVVVKNEKGALNLDSLKVVQEKKKPASGEAGKPQKAPQLQVDLLRLNIGKVVYKDYSKGTPPRVMEYNVNINEEFRNIDNISALASIIIVRALANTAISAITNFNIGPLQQEVAQTLKKATALVGETAKKATETAVQVGKQAKQAVEAVGTQAKNTVKKTTEAIKGLLPIGQKK